MQDKGAEQKKADEGEEKVTNNCDGTSTIIQVNSDLESAPVLATSSNIALQPEKSGQVVDADNSETSAPLANVQNEVSLDVTSENSNYVDDSVNIGVEDVDSPAGAPKINVISFKPLDFNISKDDPL